MALLMSAFLIGSLLKTVSSRGPRPLVLLSKKMDPRSRFDIHILNDHDLNNWWFKPQALKPAHMFRYHINLDSISTWLSDTKIQITNGLLIWFDTLLQRRSSKLQIQQLVVFVIQMRSNIRDANIMRAVVQPSRCACVVRKAAQ
jgi:hypothetical protein